MGIAHSVHFLNEKDRVFGKPPQLWVVLKQLEPVDFGLDLDQVEEEVGPEENSHQLVLLLV